MPTEEINQSGSLESKSPFELRVNKGSKVPESAIKQALDSGDMGFIHLPQDRPSMDRECASWHGCRDASSDACIATIQTHGA